MSVAQLAPFMQQFGAIPGVPSGGFMFIIGSLGIVKVIIFAIVLILMAIFSIAASSIGINCYNSNGDFKSKHGKNYGFMVFSLIMAILLLILGVAIIALRIYIKVQSGGLV